MSDLSALDLQKASDAGMDAAERSAEAGTPVETLSGDELWEVVMGSANRAEYPRDAVARLRDAYDSGARNYW